MPEISCIFIYGGLLHYFYIKTDVVLVVPVEKSKKKFATFMCMCGIKYFFFSWEISEAIWFIKELSYVSLYVKFHLFIYSTSAISVF